MRSLLLLMAVLASGCATPMQTCIGALENGDRFTMCENGKRFECERTKYEKAPTSVVSPIPVGGVRPEPGPSPKVQLPGGWL